MIGDYVNPLSKLINYYLRDTLNFLLYDYLLDLFKGVLELVSSFLDTPIVYGDLLGVVFYLAKCT